MNPSIPGMIRTVVRKQAPTPIKRALPRWAKPRQMEKTSEPKASIVVKEVRRMAFPVLEKTIRIFPLPSCSQR